MRRSGQIISSEPSNFTFHGFDGLLPTVEQALKQIEIRRAEPVAKTHDDAVFVPAEMITPLYFEGALVTQDGGPIPEAMQQRRGSIVGDIVLGRLSRPAPIRPELVIEEEVVYLGWYLQHFGHFLLETTARMWFLDHVAPSVKVLFHIQPPFQPTGVFFELLAAFGVSRDRILIPTVQTRLRRVIVPEPLYEMSHAAHERMPTVHQRLAQRIVDGTDAFDQPVYLSRRLLPTYLRPVVGELAMEEILRENGFLIAYPERMSVADQIRLVNRHKTLVTHAGTAAYLSLFALNPPDLHILTDGIPFLDFMIVPKLIGAQAAYINCLVGGHSAQTSYLPLMLRIRQLTNYLDRRGLVSSRVRAAVAPSLQELRPEYEDLLIALRLKHLTLGNERLTPAFEIEAMTNASQSWPTSCLLAQYFAHRETSRVDVMVQQFTSLVSQEHDRSKLAYFYDEVCAMSSLVEQFCVPETIDGLRRTIQDLFGIEWADQSNDMKMIRRGDRRRTRAAARKAERGQREPGPSVAQA